MDQDAKRILSVERRRRWRGRRRRRRQKKNCDHLVYKAKWSRAKPSQAKQNNAQNKFKDIKIVKGPCNTFTPPSTKETNTKRMSNLTANTNGTKRQTNEQTNGKAKWNWHYIIKLLIEIYFDLVCTIVALFPYTVWPIWIQVIIHCISLHCEAYVLSLSLL